MTNEITQIKEWLVANLDLQSQGGGMGLRIIDPVPEGSYMIPLGFSMTPTLVTIKDGRIFYGTPVGSVRSLAK